MKGIHIVIFLLASSFTRFASGCEECERLAKEGINAVASGNWSDPKTWPGGNLPGAGDAVVIPSGKSVVLDLSPPRLRSLFIQGGLSFADQDLSLDTEWILVKGDGSLFQIGTEKAPFRNRAVVTFHGADEEANVLGEGQMRMGTKFLGAMDGGRLELHGARRDSLSWTQFGAHARRGDRQMTLKEPVDWQVGDSLAIAPSGYSPLEAEEVTVTKVEGDTVHFEPALQFDHWGTIQTLVGRELDERAEVGLLSRNIVLQGAEDSLESHFGGHVMVMPFGSARIEGVEFNHMGQLGHKARYPLHWHLVDRYGDGSVPGKGQYAKNNSFHHSFQRAIVVHGTDDLHVEGNVAYDITSHCYVAAEDGDEEGNVFRDNLGMLIRSVAQDDFSFPKQVGKKIQSTQNEQRPGVFWMKNPNQIFIGNHAGGTEGGHGFFFDGEHTRKKVEVKSMVFENNVAHSNQPRRGINHRAHYSFLVHSFGLTTLRMFDPKGAEGAAVFKNFTAYKNAAGGIWLETPQEVIVDSILADHYISAQFSPFGGTMDNVLIARKSSNLTGEEEARPPSPNPDSKDYPSTGIYFEDGARHFRGKDLTFVGMEIATVIGRETALDEENRSGRWQFIDVAVPSFQQGSDK